MVLGFVSVGIQGQMFIILLDLHISEFRAPDIFLKAAHISTQLLTQPEKERLGCSSPWLSVVQQQPGLGWDKGDGGRGGGDGIDDKENNNILMRISLSPLYR